MSAEDEAGDAAAFEKAVDRLHKDCKREQFVSGLRRLQSLLERHEKQPYVLARRVEIEDLAERFAFGAAYEAPVANDVLAGKVVRFDPSTGYLKLVIEEDRQDDLQRVQGGLLALPAKTAGPFLLEIRGARYPSETNGAPQMILTGDRLPGTNREQTWVMVFGTPPRTQGSREVWLPASITHVDGSTREELGSQDVVSIPVGKAYRLQLKATETQLKIAVNGKTLCTGRKAKGVWGFLAFEAPTWTTLTFSGTIEPAWIQDRLDKAVLAQRQAFERTWDPQTVLPAWLFAGASPEAGPPAAERRELPVEVDRKLRSKVRRVQSALERGRLAEARRDLSALGRAGAPEAVCTYLSAQIHAELGLLSLALSDLEQSLGAAPGFLDGMLLRIQLLRRLGRSSEAEDAAQAAIAAHPRDPLPYETAVLLQLLSGRIDDAQTAAEVAARVGVRSEMLDALGKAVVRAARGPTWNAVHEYKSRNYHVLSDIDKKMCMEAARLLEEALTSYRVNFHWVTRDKEQLYKVYLFSGQRGFMNYMAELQGLMGKPTDRAAGVYSPLLKQLLIWNLPDRDAMMETVRHEGFHQYLDRFMPDAPIWFNEGMAGYHENGETVRGRLQFGRVHPEYVALLKEEGLVDLQDFLALSPPRFYAGGAQSYAQAWALVHMLREGEAVHRALFKELVEALQTGSPTEALATLFPEEKAEALGRALKVYVAELTAR